MNKLTMVAVLAVVGLLGCGPALTFTGVGEAREPKPPTCPIVLLSAPPAEGYVELGTIKIQYDTTGFLTEAEALKRKLQPEVCRVGGDAALGIANTYGTYIKAKVYSAKPSAPAAKLEGEPGNSGSDTMATEAELGGI